MEEQKQGHQSPLLHSHPSLQTEPGCIVQSRRDPTSKWEPDGQRPAHELPVCAACAGPACTRCPRPGGKAGMQKCFSLGVPRGMPEASQLQKASKTRASRCRPGARILLQHPRSIFSLRGRGGGGGRRAGPILSSSWSTSEAARSWQGHGASTACSRSAAPAILTRPFSFAVPSMTHGGRFPRAAAPPLLQTVHSFFGWCSQLPGVSPHPRHERMV